MSKQFSVSVNYLHAFAHDKANGFRIGWDAEKIGFGECDILFCDDGDVTNIQADTECMCSNDDKEFLRALFEDILNKIKIIG